MAKTKRPTDARSSRLAASQRPFGLILDNSLRISHFTPEARRVLGLRPKATGPLLSEIWPEPGAAKIETLTRQAFRTSSSRKLELREDGERFGVLTIVPLEAATRSGRTALMWVESEKGLNQPVPAREAPALDFRARALVEKNLEESEAAVVRTREELKAISANLLNLEDEERRRIAREIHDDLSQRIAQLQFDVEVIEQRVPTETRTMKQRLQNVADQIGTLAHAVRNVAHQLHPSTLDHLGLAAALRTLAREFTARYGISTRVTVRNVPRRIQPEVATCYYRVAQEALRNVAKHAPGATVQVKLMGTATELALTIADNGPGFDPGSLPQKGGLGLISMQERVRLVNGRFALRARPGRGVAIHIRAQRIARKEANEAAPPPG